MNKATVRKLMLERRRGLTPSEVASDSVKIASRFLDLQELAAASLIHSFIAIGKFNEFDTNLIMQAVRKRFPAVRTAAPKSDLAAGTLTHYVIDESTRFEENEWGILEPANGGIVSPAEIDIVIVPLLGFDRAGNRVGYGKGFYDRFLRECRADCLKIGVSFFPPVEKIDDINEFDVRLNRCLTPNETFEF